MPGRVIEQHGWGGARHTAWRVYGVVLLTVVAVGLMWRITETGSAVRHSARPQVSTTPEHRASAHPAAARSRVTAAATTGEPNPNGCTLTAGSQQVPTSAPAVSWVVMGGMPTPQAASTLGPQRNLDGVGVCFAHSPTGALLAAANLLGDVSAYPVATVLTKLAAPGGGLAVAQAQAAGQAATLPQLIGGALTLAGFTFGDYEPAQTSVSLAFNTPDGNLLSVEVQLVWQDSDWRVLTPENGSLASGELASLTGFTPWSAA